MHERHAVLFCNGCIHAVRIPRELEVEGSAVLIPKKGDNLTLTPICKRKLRGAAGVIEPGTQWTMMLLTRNLRGSHRVLGLAVEDWPTRQS